MSNNRPIASLSLLILSCTAFACGDDSPATGGAGGGTGGAAQEGGSGGIGGAALDPRFDPLIAAIEAERESFDAPGVAVAILEGGEVTFARGFGKKHPEQEAPVLATTLFRSGSTLKMQTAAALLREVEAGNVDLDEPVTTYVPELDFDLDPSWAPSMTPRHLLTHSHGMVDYLEINVPAAQKTDQALDTFFSSTFGQIGYLMAPAGRMFNYSNPGYMLTGLIIERASGESYREYMDAHLWTPLGMDRTFLLPEDVLADGDYASGKTTHWVTGNPTVAEPDSYDNGWGRPAGYAYTSVFDMATFVKFLRNGNAEVLGDEQREEMMEPQLDTEQMLDLDRYGYGIGNNKGLFLGDDYYDVTWLNHSGAINGFSASIDYVPELDFAMIVLSNTDGAYYTDSLEVALRTLTELPAPAESPDLEPDPTTYPTVAGTYLDEFALGTVIVTASGDDVSISMPDLDDANIPYSSDLYPYTPNNFVLTIQGYQYLATFLYDEPGEAKYMRTRSFVAAREEVVPPPPPSPIRAARVRAAIAQAKALPPALRLAPKRMKNLR